MEIVEQLKQDGIEKGLCRLWQMKLKSGLSVAELSDLYIRGIDFCVSEDYQLLILSEPISKESVSLTESILTMRFLE